MTQNKGSALLTALFMITLIAIIVTAISARIRNDIRRTQLIATTDRLYLASQIVGFWGMDRITDPKQNLTKITAQGKILDLPNTLKNPDSDIHLSGELFDLQGLLNLNNLLDERYQFIFYSLLTSMKMGNSYANKELLDAVVNWVRPAIPSATQDEWLDKYAKQHAPYYPPHMPMYHLSELRQVYGVSAKRYQKIMPYLTVLPELTAFNINTIPENLLRGLSTGIKDIDLQRILQLRSKKPITAIQAISAFTDKYHIPPEVFVFESYYFLAVASVHYQDITLQTFVVIKRKKDKTGHWKASIISQSINTP